MRVSLLTENEITGQLTRLPEWAQVGNAIMQTYKFSDFVQAIAFVDQVADAAEELDHHPDIDIRYSKVTLTLTTHDVQGLTSRDMDLAAVCDGLANALRLQGQQ